MAGEWRGLGCVCVCLRVCVSAQETKEHIRSSAHGVTGNCEPSDMSARNGHSPLRAASASLNHCTAPSFQLQSFYFFHLTYTIYTDLCDHNFINQVHVQIQCIMITRVFSPFIPSNTIMPMILRTQFFLSSYFEIYS